MAKKLDIALLDGETIILQQESIGYNNKTLTDDILYLTNLALIIARYGFTGKHKETFVFPLEKIQSVLLKEYSSTYHLIIYTDGTPTTFRFMEPYKKEAQLFRKSIQEMMGQRTMGMPFDPILYQEVVEDIDEILKHADNEMIALSDSNIEAIMRKAGGSPRKIFGNIVKDTIKKDFAPAFTDSIKHELGIDDLQDGFTDLGNEFRSMIGLPTKKTNKERREEKELYRQKLIDREYARRVKEAYELKKETEIDFAPEKPRNVVNASGDPDYDKTGATVKEAPEPKQSEADKVNEQIEVLKKLKELLDAGILTEEEFAMKKKQVLEQD